MREQIHSAVRDEAEVHDGFTGDREHRRIEQQGRVVQAAGQMVHLGVRERRVARLFDGDDEICDKRHVGRVVVEDHYFEERRVGHCS